LGAKRTSQFDDVMSAYDPKATSAGLYCCDAADSSRSKIVLDFQEKVVLGHGSKSHEATGIHQAFQ
jgi:hypothetical protein